MSWSAKPTTTAPTAEVVTSFSSKSSVPITPNGATTGDGRQVQVCYWLPAVGRS